MERKFGQSSYIKSHIADAGTLSVSSFNEPFHISSQVPSTTLAFKYVHSGDECYHTHQKKWTIGPGELAMFSELTEFDINVPGSYDQPADGICIDLSTEHLSSANLAVLRKVFKDRQLAVESFAIGQYFAQVATNRNQLSGHQLASLIHGIVAFSKQLQTYFCQLSSSAKKTATVDYYLDRVLRVRHAVAANSYRDFNLNELSRQVGISPFLLSRLFRQTYGMTILDFHHRTRMRMALERLPNAHNLSELAYDLGYHSLANFSKVFKKYHGLSPAKYKKARMDK